MNFTALQTRLQERAGLSTTDAGIGAANTGAAAGLINSALHRLEVEYPPGWDWLTTTGTFVTVTNQETYTFATIAAALSVGNIAKIKEVKINAGGGSASVWPLSRRSRSEADAIYPFTSSSMPELWWAEGRVLGFRPVNTGGLTCTITVIRTEPDLVAGGDTPIMPSIFHDAIVEKAAELWFRRVHNLNDAQVAGAEAKEWVTKMLAYQRPYTGAGSVTAYSDVWG